MTNTEASFLNLSNHNFLRTKISCIWSQDRFILHAKILRVVILFQHNNRCKVHLMQQKFISCYSFWETQRIVQLLSAAFPLQCTFQQVSLNEKLSFDVQQHGKVFCLKLLFKHLTTQFITHASKIQKKRKKRKRRKKEEMWNVC